MSTINFGEKAALAEAAYSNFGEGYNYSKS